ncbi:hypothetical protein QVD17_29771 [Tagetes erecta]|uniref:TRF2/HOY1 PH-like domain-containing protein n=1 Tax=Tagetes erecta TaxID=13708 RepID=A0AAD8NMX7_TARER|nr:hypothetical protein QVD17_29771 [Tagetes erecta]
MDLAPGKRTIKSEDVDGETPAHKRLKSSSLQTNNQWSLGSNESLTQDVLDKLLKEPCPLGLRIKQSRSFLELLQATFSQAYTAGTSKKDVKARGVISSPVDKLKATNFPALLLKIGQWEYASKYEGDLVAKCYFAKHKLVWEVLDGSLKNKIEIQWADIVALKANCPDDGPSTLIIVLGKQPLFFRETDPQPRKHTVWQATSDFTGGEASKYRRHYLSCSPGVLKKHYEKLIQCDTRLNFLSQQVDPFLDAPFAGKDSVNDQNALNSNGSNQPGLAVTCVNNTDTLGLVHGGFMKQYGHVERLGVVGSKGIGQVNAPAPQQSMSITDIVNQTAYCISDIKPTQVLSVFNNTSGGGDNDDQLIKSVSEMLLTDKQLIVASDEKSHVLSVNESNDYSTPDAANYHGQEWHDGNDHFNPHCSLTPENETKNENVENEKGMSRDDSFSDLVDNLPQIAPLPRLCYDTSHDGNIMGY